eukprot:CAMPEP_0206003088 /NCGR_PEP_ID=MMETSP1464-20131121/3155_1 /ASSEMBLY_ACC=CAM_ASM_001124 /TAXON_ID=119497 /ORGANISM="Exanthemachrysis gayraliae, Strain RCC1523" /LENGTH=86 /DNA_ID=CAMNT_0053376447 /DNA_START=454 /DNA_END=710 /DNA_ORIENTATION=-
MARLVKDSRVATGGGRGLRVEGEAIIDAFDDAEGVLGVAVIASGAGARVRSLPCSAIGCAVPRSPVMVKRQARAWPQAPPSGSTAS